MDKIFSLVVAPQFFSYKQSSVAWYRYGTGPQQVLCFHGYGESGQAFSFLEKHAGDRYSFIAPDLPFHGATTWKEGLLFTTKDLQEIVNGIMDQHKIPVKLLGFSLGGRMVMSLYTAIPDKVNGIVLLAPDGLKVNGWYWISTQTFAGNKLFALTMKKPQWFLGLLNTLNKLGLMNASIFKFVHYYIADKNVRELLYKRWTALRKIKPDLIALRKYLLMYNIQLQLVYGRHDRIIRPARGYRLADKIPDHCKVTLIESGHQVLHEKHVKDILKGLNDSVT